MEHEALFEIEAHADLPLLPVDEVAFHLHYTYTPAT